MPLRLLFEHPRLSAYAAALDGAGLVRGGGAAPIPRLPADADRPLSHAQARQWTLDLLDPGQSAYNLAAGLRLTGALDADRLARAWHLLSDRHEVLRSRYPARDGRPVVVVVDPPPAMERLAAAAALEAAAGRPFDLATGPLARLCLHAEGAEAHLVLLVLHHIVGDALSLQLLLRELMETYAALSQDPGHRPAPLPVQYADFAAWQRGQDASRQVRYWVEELRGAPPLLDLPTDFPRPARQGFAGGSVDFTLSGPRARALRDLAAAERATPFMVILAAYALFLGRHAGAPEVVVATPVTSRPHPELEALAGMFVNTVALRLPTQSGAGFAGLLAACREKVVRGFEHQDAPFERIVEALEPERSWAHNPVFQTMFSWKTRDPAPPALPGGMGWEVLTLPSTAAKLDITFGVLDLGEDFELRIEYRRDLFRPETAAQMALSFQALVESLLADPARPTDRLSLLHPDQAARIAAWNATGRVDDAATIHGLIAAAAPDGPVAVRDAAGAIGHAALMARSDALAAHLQTLGIGPGDRVGVALPRGIDLVSGLIAILTAGAAYVPLDPRYPAERIAHIAADAGLSLILSTAPGEGRLDLTGFWDGPPGVADTRGGLALRPAPVAVGPQDDAYLIYTSGSTGQPKGVAIRHANAVARIRWAARAFTAGERAGVLASTSICFDLSVFEIFATLALGGTVLMAEDLFALPDAPFADQVTLVNTVPTPMAELLRIGGLPPAVRTVCLAGEPLPPALARRIQALPGVRRLWNLYGPSEDTTYSTGMALPAEGPFNIGHPLPGTQAHVLDAHLQPLPPGMPGELWLSGQGVARGYRNRPEMTAERFRPNPFDTDGHAPVMYRTGDRVRRQADGTLDYLGRGDRQVKIRGFRIEPAEVESAICLIPGVAAAAVDLWRDDDGNARLAAWVEGPVPAPEIATDLTRRLPAHLVPTLIVPVAALPRLPNGKLDRAALPAPGAARAPAALPAAPRPGREAEIAAIWQRVLGIDAVKRGDNFFAIGGDSILAIQVVAQARTAGIALSPRDLFQHGTLAALAEAAEGRAVPGPAQGPQTGRQGLTPAQRRFLARDLPQPHHWNQAIVLRPLRPLDPGRLSRALGLIADWHDALRARFVRGPGGWEQHYAPPGQPVPLTETTEGITAAATALQRGFDLERGPLWGAVLAQDPAGGQRLALAAHHLIVDGVSWRILLGDLQAAYAALEAGAEPAAPRRGTGAGAWADLLAAHPVLAADRAHWQGLRADPAPTPPGTEGEALRLDQRIPPDLSRRVLEEAPAAWPVTTEELLLAALTMALRDQGIAGLTVEMESHGRPDLSEAIDLGRTVGWLTASWPLRLPMAEDGPEAVLRAVKDDLRRLPHAGVGAGLMPPPETVALRFNYLGRTGGILGLFAPAEEGAGPTRGAANPRDAAWEVNALADAEGLRLGWTHDPRDGPRVAALAAAFARHLDALAAHCLSGGDAGFTPADFPEMDLAQDDLDDLLRSL